MYEWRSNEYQPINVHWYQNADFTDYDDIKQQRNIAVNQSKIFGIKLNSN